EMMLREVLGLSPRTTGTQPSDARARGSDRNQDWRDRMRQMMQGGFGGGPPWMQPPGGEGEQRGDERRDRSAQPATPPQPTVFLAVDDRLNQIIVTGPPDKLAIAEEVITKIDTPREGDPEFTAREPQSPTVRVYRLSDG